MGFRVTFDVLFDNSQHSYINDYRSHGQNSDTNNMSAHSRAANGYGGS